MLYWIANHTGLHRRVHRRAVRTPIARLRRDLPAGCAWLPDAAVPDSWVAWTLLRQGWPPEEVIRLLDLAPEIAAELVRAVPRQRGPG